MASASWRFSGPTSAFSRTASSSAAARAVASAPAAARAAAAASSAFAAAVAMAPEELASTSWVDLASRASVVASCNPGGNKNKNKTKNR